ncbi:hypothetical protein D9613_012119 [Agrocybe pediades]|uniref:CCHC-type domain-containing protein n=1 Tax=Agrocybe pediades TaxID=84607 RepID=A0A8H4R1R2_9AGAR|nr:hypothetical protein D9613_012119 [Agrocybe pediades]
MAATPGGSNRKGGKGGGKKSHIECWNCGEKGHYKDKCPKPVKAKSGDKKEEKRDSSSKKDGSANAAAESDVDSESEGVFAAMETDSESVRSQELIPGSHSMSASISDDSDDLPGLQSVSTSEDEFSDDDKFSDDDEASDEAGWFSEVEDDAHDLDDTAWMSNERKTQQSFDGTDKID